MKILHLIYTRAISGAEKYLLDLLPGLKQQGIECEFMCVGPKKNEQLLKSYCDQMLALGIKSTLILKANNFQYFSIAKTINHYVVKNNIQIIHSHLIIGDMLAAIIKRFYNNSIRLFSTKHGYQEKYLINYGKGKKKIPYGVYYFFSKLIINKIDENITISKAIADMFCTLQLGKKKMKFLHHGVNVKETGEQKGITDPFQKLIVVGRLAEMKGHKYLISALPLILKRFPRLTLLIIGEGKLKNELFNQAGNLGIAEHVEFTGFQKPENYTAQCQLMIVPSIFEPFGLVFIEAFALKIPVVAFNVGAGNEIIDNNETGILIPPFNIEALAEKIIYLLENPQERKRIAENAYHKYLNSFTTEKMVTETASWYRSVI